MSSKAKIGAAGISISLTAMFCGPAASVATATEPVPDHAVSKSSESPAEKVIELRGDGFVKTSVRVEGGVSVETYRKRLQNGVYAESTVYRSDLRKLFQPVPYWKAGWDNGPRLYMTGTEFWSHSAATVAGIVCSVVASPIGGAICAIGADAAWSGVAPHIAKDETCYDLSQFMNKGWEKVSSEKCG